MDTHTLIQRESIQSRKSIQSTLFNLLSMAIVIELVTVISRKKNGWEHIIIHTYNTCVSISTGSRRLFADFGVPSFVFLSSLLFFALRTLSIALHEWTANEAIFVTIRMVHASFSGICSICQLIYGRPFVHIRKVSVFQFWWIDISAILSINYVLQFENKTLFHRLHFAFVIFPIAFGFYFDIKEESFAFS